MGGFSNYDAWVTREPSWFDDESWMLLLHCPVCGGWVSTRPENVVAQEVKKVSDTCYGSGPEVEEFMFQHDECPLPSDQKHGRHDVETYGGTTTWFHCKRCGADAAMYEY
jgi:hypothetical protein